jgi:hypothetical protein
MPETREKTVAKEKEQQMASTLTISTAGLNSTVGSQDDAAAQNVLLNFAYAIGALEEWQPQQKLDAVTAHLAEYMVNTARERYFQRESAELREETEENVHW